MFIVQKYTQLDHNLRDYQINEYKNIKNPSENKLKKSISA